MALYRFSTIKGILFEKLGSQGVSLLCSRVLGCHAMLSWHPKKPLRGRQRTTRVSPSGNPGLTLANPNLAEIFNKVFAKFILFF